VTDADVPTPPQPDAATPAPPPPAAPPPVAAPLWARLATSLGLAVAAVVSAQVLVAIAEGLALKRTDPQGIPGDLLHRLGYPFGSLGATAGMYLIIAVVLVSIPALAKAPSTDRQQLAAAVTLGLTLGIAVILALGSILAVRYNLHLYAASRRTAPGYVRLQLVAFLLGALGSTTIAFFGSLTAMRLRDR
jgi:hypothetical protein